MRKLYAHILSPTCRKVRITLAEKGLSCDIVAADFYNTRKEFLMLNPTGEIPVFIDADSTVVAGDSVICEYLDEVYSVPALLGADVKQKAEVRRLVRWFDDKFAREVTFPLLREKVLKSLHGAGAPDSKIIRQSKEKIKDHFAYIKWMVDRHAWLAGDNFSYADIAAAAQVSVVDYLGDVAWDYFKFAEVKDWYVKIKSRPSFRGIMKDRQLGFSPPSYYSELDF